MARRLYGVFGGEIKGTPWESLSKMYLQRLTYWTFHSQEIVQWKEEKLKPFFEDKYVVALCERGKLLGSQEFSAFIEKKNQGHHSLCFVVGHFDGFPSFLQNYIQEKISFGPMTFTHLTARILFLEQLYRSQQLLLGHPYTKV